VSGGHEHGGTACREIFARLSEYIDDELPADLCSRLESHMEDCPPCRVFLDSLRRTVGLIGRLEDPPMPEDLRRAVREAYERYRSESG
jgi:anti-sigma factor (TIGR02949 family)